MSAMADERPLPPDDEPDQTRPHEPDQTRPPEPTPEPSDPWASGDETTMLPPTGGDRWSGRAGVRPGQPPEGRTPLGPPPVPPYEALPEEEYAEEAGRRWWAPAVVGLIAFVLLGMLVYGVWLILNALERPAVQPPPAPSPTVSSASTAAAPSPTATRSPRPSPAATIAVPPVVDLPLDDAKKLLDQAGLKYQVVERPDGNARPNTVVAVSPAPGTGVPVGSTVTLYVAVAPRTPERTTLTPTVRPTR